MSPRLEDFPNEVIETIVELLDLKDIFSLRLSCRSLATKASQTHFKSFYRSKHIEIVKHELQNLVTATQHNQLGCLVQALILQNRQIGAYPVDQNLDLLSQAFRNIAASKKRDELISLSLEIEIPPDHANRTLVRVGREIWKVAWDSAAQAFLRTMRALSTSKLRLEKLNVFNNPHSGSCSLACDQLGRVDFSDEGLVISLSSLKSLSISLSDTLHDDSPIMYLGQVTENDDREAARQATAKSNFVGLARFLEAVPSLEILEIHYYRLRAPHYRLGGHHFIVHHQYLLHEAAKSKNLPKLKDCILRGVYIDAEDLLAFIKATTPRRLVLEYVFLKSGSFQTIFDYCITEDARMDELDFGDLFEEGNMLQFRYPNDIDYAAIPDAVYGSQTSTWFKRSGDKVRQAIVHCRIQDQFMPKKVLRQRRALYGPLYR